MIEEKKVHDHGFVKLLEVMGDDEEVVNAARISYGKGTKKVSETRNLIRYLMRHKHTSPFEMCEVKFHLKLPIFIMRQLVRHRTANINEYSDAMVAYGIVYLEGFGVEQDEEKGLVFIKRAMKLGSLQAMYEYGTVLYTGIEGIIDENEELAFSLFDEAASKGHIGAQFMAADMMLEACGTPMNVDKAIRYLAKSAESGHRFARQRMRELFDECKEKL